MRRILVVSTGDRRARLEALLASFQVLPWSSAWRLSLVLQAYPDDYEAPAGSDVIRLPSRVGPFRARLLGLETWRATAWCSLDDDMLLTKATDYDTPTCRVIEDPGVGLVSTGWSRSAKARASSGGPAWVCSPIVYTGGGLIMSDQTAYRIRRHGKDIVSPVLFDDVEWSLVTYLAGQRNYRYRGSHAVHQVCTSGGRRAWIQDHGQDDWLLPDRLYIQTVPVQRPGYPGDRFQIPSSRELTQAARATHRLARKIADWK